MRNAIGLMLCFALLACGGGGGPGGGSNWTTGTLILNGGAMTARATYRPGVAQGAVVLLGGLGETGGACDKEIDVGGGRKAKANPGYFADMLPMIHALDMATVQLDLPGQGCSSLPGTGDQVTFQSQSTALAAAMSELTGRWPNMRLVGHSVGGALALRYSADNGDKLRGVAVLGFLPSSYLVPPKVPSFIQDKLIGGASMPLVDFTKIMLRPDGTECVAGAMDCVSMLTAFYVYVPKSTPELLTRYHQFSELAPRGLLKDVIGLFFSDAQLAIDRVPESKVYLQVYGQDQLYREAFPWAGVQRETFADIGHAAEFHKDEVRAPTRTALVKWLGSR